MRLIYVFIILAGLMLNSRAADDPVVMYVDAPRPFLGAQTFKDKDSGILFYVESDGRHVAAIDRDGKILWNRDPFVEGKLKPYRREHPVIVFIGEPLAWMTRNMKGKFISISFNSSQFGLLNIETGAFIFLGQD